MKCDGLQYPCDNEARHRIVLAFQPEATPPVLDMHLCDSCFCEWCAGCADGELPEEVERVWEAVTMVEVQP